MPKDRSEKYESIRKQGMVNKQSPISLDNIEENRAFIMKNA